MVPIDDYPVIVREDDNGTYVCHVPGLPGCHAWGRTAEEARRELASVFEMTREECVEEGRPFPAALS
ncbi:MAG: type II toxin-antitoxin system HicB family antitoxin [Armatimonadetes bacterium CG_4_10_14_3_um_filter_66_18]|nr:type II toxin-antitoxin system HicB family antitoxin [Armatimonadota bacterium]PIW20005.1 MAG: type II toxin-antitoxin system HicB family antitoxin [Armatimonadetes bacterium CG17_big_fil_post_rev_8_21_14_2_50_66_6]PIX36817.1 MAG: type II toxin-antitoxin system HicB family antitoxin [Armatimonadetes bacterium CG_4_8_14_3_um_filter_66_20]PIY50264.1 MAG: type II toxin-antitoxin system HicB family antitoxin [Armatimonadetes bacterium CG_4_10_14_3_um_filter_66_18]PIZ42847.1 MAG: type II toxin-an